MFQFPPAKHRTSEMQDVDLTSEQGIIQCLRGFACRASILLAAYTQLMEVYEADKKGGDWKPTGAGSRFLIRHIYMNTVVMDLRSLLDHRKDSFGVAYIADCLADPAARKKLYDYLDGFEKDPKAVSAGKRDSYLDYIQHYCGLLKDAARGEQIGEHSLVAKARLVKRMSNKTVAHISLDDYTLDGEDLHHLMIAVMTLACAIQSVMTKAAYPESYRTCEKESKEDIAEILGVEVDTFPEMIDTIETMLPTWIRMHELGPGNPGADQIFEPFMAGCPGAE